MNGVGVAPKEIDRSTPPITSKRGPKKGCEPPTSGTGSRRKHTGRQKALVARNEEALSKRKKTRSSRKSGYRLVYEHLG